MSVPNDPMDVAWAEKQDKAELADRLRQERDFLLEALEMAYQKALGIPESFLYFSLEEVFAEHKEKFGDTDKLEEGE